MNPNTIVIFLKEVREELKKVVWPTTRETARLTVIVIGVSAAVGVYLTILDYLLNKIVGLIVK